MLLAILVTLAALLLGISAAYRLTHYRVPGGEIVRMLQSVPIIVPGIIVGVALLRTLVIPTGATILLALFPAHSALVLPFAVRVVSASMENLRTDIEEAAMLLGCSRSGAFRRVVLPNIRGGVLAAVSRLCHQLQPGSGIPFFSGPGVRTLPIDRIACMEINYNPSIAALSALLAFLSVAIVFAAERCFGFFRHA